MSPFGVVIEEVIIRRRSASDPVKPLLVLPFYLFRYVEALFEGFGTKANADLGGRHSQVGSLAGAVHLLNVNAGVLWIAQREQKSLVDQKGKSLLDFDFQYEYKL